MMKYFGIAAILGLTACTFSPDQMFYEVTQRSANGVSIQGNIGNMKHDSSEVTQMTSHIDGLALKECQAMGGRGANFINQSIATAGPYYTWLKINYSCA